MPDNYLMLMPFDGLLNEAKRLKAENESLKARIAGGVRVLARRTGTLYDWELVVDESYPDPNATLIFDEEFPKPQRKDGGKPCGECHLKAGETCDICGAVRGSE